LNLKVAFGFGVMITITDSPVVEQPKIGKTSYGDVREKLRKCALCLVGNI